jgi:hypothetical protein
MGEFEMEWMCYSKILKPEEFRMEMFKREVVCMEDSG